ncbi:hypothetical protein PVAND_002939 [Polypedilum vanderplanki]|uniref:Uncharacterized protein n=1 Tax=Polypedilum vanderplanki TaxID=319348 RepID=A0A9J6BSY8_POLVA|nr:hypothetical protein PVAND_002939 [Polypedilum vanderplanki]
MPRKLIPLTEDLQNEESISKLKSWESHVSMPLGEHSVVRKKSNKILSMISQWSASKKNEKPKKSENLEVFNTKKVSKEAAYKKAEEPKDNVEIKKNKKKENETKVPQAKPEIIKISNKINYEQGKNISIESFKPSNENYDDDLKPCPPSRSPSLILPQVPTKNYFNLIKPKTGIILNSDDESKSCEKFTFDPREKQKLIDGKPVKVFKRGEEFFVKINDELNDEEKSHETLKIREVATCRPAINVKVPQLNLLMPLRKVSTFQMTLGKPITIRLGSHNIMNDLKTKDLNGNHATDAIIVAHAMSHFKHPANWTERDIDQILMMGAELYNATKDVKLDRLIDCTKGFTYKENFIQVKISEPVIIGKILTLSDRSMDLFNGLRKYFYVYRQGIFESMKTTLYIVHEDGVFCVFDPRGRNEECERDDNREAALMVLMSVDNVYHLILNMSKINTKAPFKISNVKMTKYISKKLVKDEFMASCGEKKLRSADYGILNDDIAVLVGNLSLNSSVFDMIRNRHGFGLTTCVMAMIYAKIDPAISWCKTTLDNVLHFGYKLHSDCLNGEKAMRSIQLTEIPSKFYVSDSYCVQIAIAAYIQRTKMTTTRFLFNNPITTALIESLKVFKCLILEVDNYSFAVWRSETADTFFFFDPYQKNLNGQIDHYDGAAVLLMFNTIDHLCENVITRLLAAPRFAASELKLHGMKIIELKKLNKKQLKNRPKFRLASNKCIRPFTADDAKLFQDVPSTIDSIVPELTKEQQTKLFEEKLKKSKCQEATDLNSPSLVCFKMRAYEEIMASLEKKLSVMKHQEVSNETMEIMREIYSEILLKIDENDKMDGGKSKVNLLQSESTCGELMGIAERVLLKTDLNCLEKERKKLLKKLENPSEETIDIINDEELTLSKEKLVKSHYQELPDMTQIIRGTKSIYALPLDPNIFNYENYSVLIGISAILTSTKYSIATWSPEIIDYILGCGQIMASALKLTHRMSFYTADEHNLPKIHINDKFYDLKMTAIANGEFNQLENYLNEILPDIDRILIVTTCGSIAVFKHKNFYYLFEYATCNMVGYRIRNDDFGSSCAMRFDNLHALVRRIHANHSDVMETQKFLIYRVIITDTETSSDKRSFIPFTASQEKIIIDALRHNRMTKREEMIKKLKENDAKVREEKERLRSYRDETGAKDIPSDLLIHTDFDESQLPKDDDDYELDLSVYDRMTMTKNDDDMQRPLYDSNWNELRQIGYDINSKTIRGTFGYANRMSDNNKLQACHFASIYAIIYAIHHVFETMNYRCVDVILENGMRIFDSGINLESYANTKTLSQMIVDEMSYELKILEFYKKAVAVEKKTFIEFFTKEQCAVVESNNCKCMAIVKSNSNYHIFDPYDVNDMADDSENLEIENPIASWSLHENLESVVEYVKQRLLQPIMLHRILIISSKKLKSMPMSGYFLFNTPPMKSTIKTKTCEFVELSEDEKIEWITKTKVIPWSRLQHCNADGVKRYTSDSKFKEFDIEISKKLFSLWGNIHPNMKLFRAYAGKQHLACCVVTLIMSNMFNIDEWDAVLLDSICTHGHKYLIDMISKFDEEKQQLEVNDLSGSCRIQDFNFNVELDLVIFGKLYEENRKRFNLRRAFEYVFGEIKLPGVVLICNNRSLAIGNVKNETFFMYDSQSYGAPLFKSNQGTTYVLKCCCMKVLLACIILTLNVRQHNVKFHLYAVHSKLMTNEEENK